MPSPAKGAHLWLRPARRDGTGRIVRDSRWLIKDRGRQISTGFGACDRIEAEKRLATYIAEKYQPARNFEIMMHAVEIRAVRVPCGRTFHLGIRAEGHEDAVRTRLRRPGEC
jgi:hypothetical protein